MTSHYVEIAVLPDVETGESVLIGTLYDKLHRRLVQSRVNGVGISFPRYSVNPRSIGNTLRLHGNEAVLHDFMATNWLHGLRDHVRITAITPVPVDASHRNVLRRQFKSNVERLRRRRMKRKGETAQQAALAIPDAAAEKPTLPYLHLRSLSTGQPFCLFIAMGERLAAPIAGTFNAYGLGERGATVPWF